MTSPRRSRCAAFAAVLLTLTAAAQSDEVEEILRSPVGDRRARLVEIAFQGDLRAAARMVQIGMWDEMERAPIESAPLVAWRTSADTHYGMTGTQVYADWLANWASRNRGKLAPGEADRRGVEARTILEGTAIEEPLLRVCLAWCYREFEPKDVAKADAEDAKAQADLLARSGEIDALAVAARKRTAAYHLGKANLAQADELFAQAAQLCGDAGDKVGQAQVLFVWGSCLEPTHNPHGDWSRAAETFDRAADLARVVGDNALLGRSLFQRAWCLAPERNPRGTWLDAAGTSARAAEAYAAAGDKVGQAKSLVWEGHCFKPSNNPWGDWGRAESAYFRAVRLCHDAGDKKSEAHVLLLYAECFVPGRDPKGDWNDARARFEEAARVSKEAGDEHLEALSLGWWARCIIRDDPRRMTESARELLCRAADLAREAGDERQAKAFEAWLR